MRRTLFPLLVVILFGSCSESNQYKEYFDNTHWILDSVSDKYGETVNIHHDGVMFYDGIMKTYWLSDPNEFSQSSYRVSNDTLFIGVYQSYKILQADENNIVYKYHVPISTGTNTWEYTYHMTRVPEKLNYDLKEK